MNTSTRDRAYHQLRSDVMRIIISAGATAGWAAVAFSLVVDPTNLGSFVIVALALSIPAALIIPALGSQRVVQSAIYITLFGLSGLVIFAPVDLISVSAAAALVTVAALVTNPVVFGASCLPVVGAFASEFILLADSPEEASIDILLALIAVMTLGFVTQYVNYTFQRIVGDSNRANELLRVTADVSEITARILDLDELFNRAVDLIRDQFGFYHVQVFLVDEQREYANLVASTGAAGEQLLQRNHRLSVGSRSVIGQVTQSGNYNLSRAAAERGVHAANELLPNTRSELALPIIDGDSILGALDVQSEREDAFGELDVQALQLMAGQLAAAIRNARLFSEQNQGLLENKRLLFESEANFREIQRLNRQLSGQAWDAYMEQRKGERGVTFDSSGAIEVEPWSTHMVEAAQKQRPVVHDGEQKTLAAPIMLRGHVIGAIELEASADMPEEDVVEMTQAVASRLAVSLDNARLFEEAQENSSQEQRINEIVDKFQSAVNVDELLQVAIAELSAAVGADHSSIRLGDIVVQDTASANGSADNVSGSVPHD